MTSTSSLSSLFALLILALLTPLLIGLYVICLAAHGRPVMFRQFRAGKAAKPFRLLKYRTMRDDRDENGKLLPDEQRVTAVGSFLRRTRLDELPGLVNVLRGEMAFVGPRPLLPETIEELGERGRMRCAARPGLTGWSQVNGNTLLTLDQKIALVLWYIEHRSLLLDMKILARTLLVVVGGEKVRSDTA